MLFIIKKSDFDLHFEKKQCVAEILGNNLLLLNKGLEHKENIITTLNKYLWSVLYHYLSSKINTQNYLKLNYTPIVGYRTHSTIYIIVI